MRLGAVLSADRNMLFLFKKSDSCQRPKKEECQLTLVMLCPVLSTHDDFAMQSLFGICIFSLVRHLIHKFKMTSHI